MAVDRTLKEIKIAFGPAIEVYPLAKQLELIDLRLLDSASTIKLDTEIQNVTNINHSINISFNKLNEPARIAFQYSLSVFGVSKSQEEVIRISATYGEMFRVKSGETFPNDKLEIFGQIVGLNIIWPFWREFVQTITTRMNIPPLTLPIMRPGDFQFTKDKKEEDTQKKRARRTSKKT